MVAQEPSKLLGPVRVWSAAPNFSLYIDIPSTSAESAVLNVGAHHFLPMKKGTLKTGCLYNICFISNSFIQMTHQFVPNQEPMLDSLNMLKDLKKRRIEVQKRALIS